MQEIVQKQNVLRKAEFKRLFILFGPDALAFSKRPLGIKPSTMKMAIYYYHF